MPNKRWKSEDKVVQDNDAEIEWSEEEKNRLLEALKKYVLRSVGLAKV